MSRSCNVMKRYTRLNLSFSRSERTFGTLIFLGVFLFSVWTNGAHLAGQQPTLRFTPPVFSTRPDTSSSASSSASPSAEAFSPLDSTPIPGPTERTTVRFGTPANRSLPALVPVESDVQEPGHAETLQFAPHLQTPMRLEQDNVVENGRSSLAPTPLPLPTPIDRRELDEVLQNGKQLEIESRWGDVLTHYETALRIYRNDTTLMDRFRVARFHYDIGRRYHDASYLKMIQSSGFTETLALFEEIVNRIQTNYVDMPHWDELFRYGIQDVEIALSDPFFRNKAGLSASADKVREFIETMNTTADGWEIRNREDMKNGILRLAEIAMQQINLNPSLILMEFTCGIVNSLDPYTAYLTPNQLNDTFSMISGNFVGLGVELKSDRESLLIVRVIQGSPAQLAGLKDGDRILTIDGISTRGRDTDSAADLLQGTEGTVVKLVVQSPGKQARALQVTRRRVDVPSIEDVRMLNESLGYVKLTGFQSKTCEELKQAIAELNRRGMHCLVLDLRHNPGGLLQVGIEVANLFIDEGVILRRRGRGSNVDTPDLATKDTVWKMPLIVLIDEESASASEIVAGAIRDHQRGVIVGKRSYGKGTIQAILPASGNPGNAQSGLRLTVEKFYSPQGWPYSGVGVTPHVQVETPQRVNLAKLIQGRLQIPVVSRTVSSSPEDPFIRKAIETSREMIPQTAQRP